MATIDFGGLVPPDDLRRQLEAVALRLPLDWRIRFVQHPAPGAFLELAVEGPSPPVYPSHPKWLLPPLAVEGALLPLAKLEKAWEHFLETEALEVLEAWQRRDPGPAPGDKKR